MAEADAAQPADVPAAQPAAAASDAPSDPPAPADPSPPPPPPAKPPSVAARRGTLAVTCAPPALGDVASAACSQLRGLRLCPFGSAAVTHLVLAEPKRTMKVLHAIARGAWLLTPEWLYRSVEAGAWQPEEQFEDSTFAGGRLARLAAPAGGLLKGLKVSVLEPRKTAPPASELRLLVTAAGGTLVKGKASAQFVIAAKGDGRAAAAAAQAKGAAVTEQWLFAALAEYAVPTSVAEFKP